MYQQIELTQTQAQAPHTKADVSADTPKRSLDSTRSVTSGKKARANDMFLLVVVVVVVVVV